MKKTTIEEAQNFEKLQAQLTGFYQEINALSKKNPNDKVNEFKLKIINKSLTVANKFFDKDKLPIDGFDVFELESLPSNSDVLLILGQYINCLDEYKLPFISRYGKNWYWLINDKRTEILTSEPMKIK